MNPNGTALPLIDRIRNVALLVGLAGALVSVGLLAAQRNWHNFDRAYLFSFVFVLGLSLGSMALLMLHRQLGGAWGFLIRRPLEASCMTLPLVAVLFAPVLYDLEGYYPWVNHRPGTHDTSSHAELAEHGEAKPGAGTENDPAATPTPGHPTTNTAIKSHDVPEGKGSPVKVAGRKVGTGGESAESLGVRKDKLLADTDKLFAFKRWWLTPAHFTIRMVIYFAIWIAMALILNVYSRKQDETRSWRIGYNLQSFSAPGLVIYFLTTSLALVDWGMSLEPDWYSSLYGVLLMIGQGLSTISLMIIMTAILSRRGETPGLDTNETYNDLGNLLLAFTMLWGYLSFSQFLIIWSGNLSEEIPWYARRLSYGWINMGRFLIVFHFFLPFLILLARPLKRNIDALWKIAALMLGARMVDVYWQITPSFNVEGPRAFLDSISLFDLTVPAGVFGIWFAAFLYILRGKPLMVVDDPELLPALKQAGGH